MHGDHDDGSASPPPRGPARTFFILHHGRPMRATVAEFLRWSRGTSGHRPCTSEPFIEHTRLHRDGDCDGDEDVMIITEFESRHPRIDPLNRFMIWTTVVIGGPENGAKWRTTTLAKAKRDHFGAVDRHLRRGWLAEPVPENWVEMIEDAAKGG